MKTLDLFQRALRADAARPSLPGEHWAVFGMAVSLLRSARRARSPLGRLALGAGAIVLLARAVGGRDGIVQALRSGGLVKTVRR